MPTKKKKTVRKKKKSKSLGKVFYLFLFVFGIIGFSIFWFLSKNSVETPEHFADIVPKGYKSVGIDVSHHQGEINWDELFFTNHFDTIIEFVYCKSSEGSDHVDRQFVRNFSELERLNVPHGAYHYFKPKSLPRPQAAHFLSCYSPKTSDLPPVLDVEEEGFSDSDLIAKVKIWCAIIQAQTGRKPIIYTSLDFYEKKFRGKIDEYKFWLAAYSREPIFMTDREVVHWQFSESAKLPGIENEVDLNVSKIDFKKM